MNALNNQKIERVLVVAPHPDDAEIAMGGMIISLCKQGVDVHVADLTNGEPTPHGTAEIRKKESEQASNIMGISKRYCLQMPNRYLENTLEYRNQFACLIREIRPQMMFTPVKPDDHPDHLAASDIVHGARFEAKLHKTDMPGKPHWVPTLIGYYSPHRKLHEKPDMIFDISDFWEGKAEAISSYESQLKNTRPGDLSFLEKTKAVNGYFGQSINCRYGEPFKLFDPLGVYFGDGGLRCGF
jgi:bacillithiol biosynthesis deacetylase BshB1